VTYAAQADLVTRFGADEVDQLSERYGVGSSSPAQVIAAALADADVEIDGYLAAAYTLPLTSTPALVVLIACDIARYRLWKDQAGEHVRQRYEDAVAMLRRIASGDIKLTISGVTAAGEGGVRAPTRTLAFGDDFEEDYLPAEDVA
jgi:phage gp36-like protein